ncbi:MAG: hypothetical protein GY938_15115 [Ketobacter sp.]|nr:hypothetical protein [Ketobacter sp.]
MWIGAYLVRLTKRIIQKSDSPILLTGYVALNNLLGKSVYISNQWRLAHESRR